MAQISGNGGWAASVNAVLRMTPKWTSSRVAPLELLLGGLARYVESWTDDLLCSVQLVDPTGSLLRPGAAPSLPPEYVRAIDPVPIAAGHGSCGTAAALREIVVVEDVERSPLWSAYAPIAVAHGLRACWSVPITADAHGLLGTLALYYGEPRKPSPREIDLLRFAAALAAIVIQRHRDTKELRHSEARYRTLARLVHGYVFEGRMLPDNNIEFTWADDAFADLFGCDRTDVNRRGWRSFVDPRDSAAVEKRLAAIAAGNVGAIELRITGAAGRQRWLRMAAEPLQTSAAGAEVAIIGMAEDITERKTLLEQMFEAVNREQIRIANIDVTDDGVGIGETDGDGFGLRTMSYRAETIGAELSIDAVRPRGTRVSVRLPLRCAEPAL